ncbi:MAG: PocR ligand-binding domain-containing protein [Anaerolineales bacterium]|nr:PocR ligand-binding domain-containing protein [Anaerolineales bacterium]
MPQLLSSKQVQELLKIDRTTVYRMLNDGRLTGIKVGSQWRFDRREIDALLSAAEIKPGQPARPLEVLPVHCIQSIQNVFAQIAEVGAITTDRYGQPVTEISHCSPFCSLILASPSGREACIRCWKDLAKDPDREPSFVECHAGLQYARGCIKVDGSPSAMIISGQFYLEEPDPGEEKSRIDYLAQKYGIDAEALRSAAKSLRVLDKKMEDKIGIWMTEVAKTFGEISSERFEVLKRLKLISEMSNLDSDV